MKTRIFSLLTFALISLLTANLNAQSDNKDYYNVNAGTGKGVRFWNSNYYKIHMGNSSYYKYGPVTDYSIKMNMNDNSNRGWTWGKLNQSPIAALNTQGTMQLAKDLRVMGKIGVGTTTPEEKLDVRGSILATNSLKIKGEHGSIIGKLWISDSYEGTDYLMLSADGSTEHMRISSDGNIAIGDSVKVEELNSYRLTVDGTIKAEELILEDVGADFVFEEGYNLRSLEEVERFINENNHLPDVAPASETTKGINVSEFNTMLLQKIEELTLYMIELNKDNDILKAENKELNDKVESLVGNLK